MKYEVRTRLIGTQMWQCYFQYEHPSEIAELETELGPKYEFKISTVGDAIETIYHPHKGCIVKDVLTQTRCMAPIDAPFAFHIFGWEGHANEAIIHWVFDNLVECFAIETIQFEVAKLSNRVRYTVNVKRKGNV